MTDTDSPCPAGQVSELLTMRVAGNLFATQVLLVRRAGFSIEAPDDMFSVRPPHEAILLKLAGDLHTALASLRMLERGKPVPVPTHAAGQDAKAYWTGQAEIQWATLVTAARVAAGPGGDEG